jgi:hypothetical protein
MNDLHEIAGWPWLMSGDSRSGADQPPGIYDLDARNGLVAKTERDDR